MKLICTKCGKRYSSNINFCPACHGSLILDIENNSSTNLLGVVKNQSVAPTKQKGNQLEKWTDQIKVRSNKLKAYLLPWAGISKIFRPTKIYNKIPGQSPIFKAWSIILIIFCIFAIAGSFITSGEYFALLAANNTPLASEIKLAQDAIDKESKFALTSDAPEVKMVEKIGQKLVNGLPLSSSYREHYRFYVIPSNDMNAFALPGGAVFIYTGLLSLAGKQESLIAAVLAHEIGHIENRHGLRASYQSLSIGALTLWTFGLSNDLGGAFSRSLINTHYSRGLELEADDYGLQLLQRSGYDQKALPSLLRKLDTNDSNSLAWLSSHPASKERARIADEKIKNLGTAD